MRSIRSDGGESGGGDLLIGGGDNDWGMGTGIGMGGFKRVFRYGGAAGRGFVHVCRIGLTKF